MGTHQEVQVSTLEIFKSLDMILQIIISVAARHVNYLLSRWPSG